MPASAHKQVTRGHIIVADGWAGASNPHSHPMPPHQHTYQKKSKTLIFPLFDSCVMDGRTDRRTDRWTDRPTDGRTYGPMQRTD